MLKKVEIMKRSTFSILFIARKHKLLKNNEAPIYVRITVNGKAVELATKRSVPPEEWDVNKNCSKRKTRDAKELNDFLDQTKHKLFQIQKDLDYEGREVNVESIKNRFLGNDSNKVTLIQI